LRQPVTALFAFGNFRGHFGPLFVDYGYLLNALSKNIVYLNSIILEISSPKCNIPITNSVP